MKKGLLAVIPLLLLVPVVFVSGATIRGGEEPSVSGDEVVRDDLYIAGGDINVLGTVVGDVVAAGGNVLLDGSTSGDIAAAGGQMQVLSMVGDDLRLAGGSISVGGRVGGDLVVAGGNVKLLSSGIITGDAIVAGGRVVIDGAVRGNVRTWAGEVVINGSVSGNVEIHGADKVTLGKDAVIYGNLTYTSKQEATIAEGARVVGETSFTQKETKEAPNVAGAGFLFALAGAFALGKIILILITSIAAVLLFKRFTYDVVSETLDNFVRDGFVGLAALVAIPVGLIILAISFVGLMAAGLGALAYGLLLVLAKICAGIVVGGVLAKWVRKEVIVDWKWTAVGVLVLQIVSLVPVVGWLVSLVIFLATLGALSVMGYRKIWIAR